MREVIARIVDRSEFTEFGADYGSATVCGHAALYGQPIGIITNNGPIDPAGANKATHFIQSCCQAGIAAAVPAEHHRLHRRQGQRAGRHDQARLEDDPGGEQRHRAEHHADVRRQLRRRQLRHVRPRLRPALRLQLAQHPHRGDGRRAGRADHAHRRRGRCQAQGRAGGRGRAAGAGEEDHPQLRQPVRRLLHQRHPARRRRHRPARHAPACWAWPSTSAARPKRANSGRCNSASPVPEREPPCNTCSTPKTTSRCRTR